MSSLTTIRGRGRDPAHSEEEFCLLTEETEERAILDSGCSRTVAGFKWFGRFFKKLPEEDAKRICTRKSDKIYQFGTGGKRCSKGWVELPVIIGGRRMTIVVQLVEAEIPLLLGANFMEKAGVKMDFCCCFASIFGQEIKMIKIGSGLFCIDIMSKEELSEENFGLEKVINDRKITMVPELEMEIPMSQFGLSKKDGVVNSVNPIPITMDQMFGAQIFWVMYQNHNKFQNLKF